MRGLLIILFFSYTSIAAQAQPADSTHSQKSQLYAGVGLNGRYFLIDYNTNGSLPAHSDYFVAKIYSHVGYRISNRIEIEVGAAYANDKDHYSETYVEAPGKYIHYHDYSHTRGFMLPVKLNHMLFKVWKKRLTLYGTGSIIPAYSTTKIKKEEVKEDITTTTYTGNGSGFDVFFSSGIGAKFKIWKQFSGYSEVNVLDTNVSGKRADPWWDLRRRDKPFSHLSYGLGVNYSL